MVEEILGMLTNPNIVFILLSIGVQAILIEISSPGGWVAGTIGVILLALAVYGLGILPVNWFGIIFLIIAFILFIMDIKAPTHGALTIAGVASFITGALILFNSASMPGFPRVSVGLVVGDGCIHRADLFRRGDDRCSRAQKTHYHRQGIPRRKRGLRCPAIEPAGHRAGGRGAVDCVARAWRITAQTGGEGGSRKGRGRQAGRATPGRHGPTLKLTTVLGR
jgi:membrane-bound ClpP family serine protease